ncbi:hypothetical protein PAXRUDRAFT_30491 [Paxillus rubicundulus Ve08.2h10]|uniref:Uncharacterized protein n=1 Tax=Paxillus rubicundulus Ve08.2h10 TaxID=930991 RepID=A0A0D0DLK0_9AGAM|nr:hypothetical protein PAXRUDRAFT_30491 [Paxillus rubicundulus Ve08.2h10]
MIFIVIGIPPYQLGVKTLLVGLVALLCGLLGCLTSVLALVILWVAPTIGPQSPRTFKYKHPLPPAPQPRQPNALGVFLDPPPVTLANPQSSAIHDQPPPLKRSASFPPLHKTGPQQTCRPASAPHVSFSLSTPLKSNSPVIFGSPAPVPPSAIQRRWSSAATTFNKLKSTTQETARTAGSTLVKQSSRVQGLPLRCFDNKCECNSRVNKFGPMPRCSSPEPLTTLSKTSIPSPMRLPQMRLPLSKKRRSSSVSHAPILPELDENNCLSVPPDLPIVARPKSNSSPRSSGEIYRTGFINPFTKKSKSRSQSPPSTSGTLPKSKMNSSRPSDWVPLPDVSSPSSKPSQPASRDDSSPSSNSKIAKLTSIFKPSACDSPHKAGPSLESPIVHSRSFLKTMSSKFRRKPVARTEPYGPPWNAQMPGQTSSEPRATRVVSGRSRQTINEKVKRQKSSSPKRTGKSPRHGGLSLSLESVEQRPTLLGPLSPRTLASELDERLSILQRE